MTSLDSWLQRATRHLSKDSAARVRSEIQDHYESEREAASSRGVAAEEAGRLAIAALGDPKTANCQYRKVLLTASEARLLRQGNWEARAVCSRSWLKSLLLALPATALLAASFLFFTGEIAVARTLLAGAIALGLMFAAPWLPLYTPWRSRVFRVVKWAALIALLGTAFGRNALDWLWLLIACAWPVFWIEWTRVSIRRKLPAAEWPRQLYL
jgi:hypothetical protein